MKYALAFIVITTTLIIPFSLHAKVDSKSGETETSKESPALVIKKLPPPDKQKGLSVMQALEKRRSNRLMKDEVVSDQELSNILWAAWGINDNAGDKHTAPSYLGLGNVMIYISLPDGVWLYKPLRNTLQQVLKESITEQCTLGKTELIYAIQPDKYAYMLLGSVYQNVGLYCASKGLFNTIRASKVPLIKGKIPLDIGYEIIVTHKIGWPR